MMIDIDDFKAFNDTYGHMEGDRVIEHLGAAIRRCTRKSDIACRYGGEEFVVLLPETSTVQATVMAERMREVFQAHSFHPRNARRFTRPSASASHSARWKKGPDPSSPGPIC
jgi:diguanylate cyclase (GGDEF)-like protein